MINKSINQVLWELGRILLCIVRGVGGKGGHDQGGREIWDVIIEEQAFAR